LVKKKKKEELLGRGGGVSQPYRVIKKVSEKKSATKKDLLQICVWDGRARKKEARFSGPGVLEKRQSSRRKMKTYQKKTVEGGGESKKSRGGQGGWRAKGGLIEKLKGGWGNTK